jgi:3',5'-cyclic-AMP phosphodiesterase
VEGGGGSRRVAALTAAMMAAAGACVEPTPFDVSPSERELTATNLELIRAGAPPDSFKFVALGDTHDAYSALADAVDAINARDDIAFVVHAGDQSDLGLRGEYEFTRDQLARLAVPHLTVIGNHDALGDGAEIYRRMYGPLDYSVEIGAAKFIFFNSNSLEFPGQAPDGPWLERQLMELDGARSAIWVTHQEVQRPDDVPGGDSRELYARLLDQYPVTSLVVHGHRIEHKLYVHHDVPVLQCGTFQVLFTYNLVTVRGGIATSIEICDPDGCDSPVALR